jgi:beta-lactamase regulating signal transducer with metallopeptidase domain
MTWELLADGPKALAEFGLTWLCQSSALLALGMLAGRMLRRSGPAVQSAAYRTTLAAVLVCPVASTLLTRAGFDGVTLRLPIRAGAGEATPAPERLAASWPAPAPTDLIAPGRPSLDSGKPIEPTTLAVGPISKAVELPAASTTPFPTGRPRASRIDALALGVSIGLTAWVLGALWLGLRLAIGLRQMARLRASAIPAGPVAEALCRDLARRMLVVAPEVLRAPCLQSPCVGGLRSPAILLPDDADVDLRDTFVHELAHLARRDVHWNLLRKSASALLWFQPLLWVLSRRLEVTAEEVCDDYVVQFGANRASYAGLLLELAGRALPPALPSAVGMISLRSLLARRVVRILDSSRSLSTKAGTRAVWLMLVTGLAGTLLAGLLGVGGPRRPALAQVPTKIEGAKSAPKDGTIRGQVVGPDGEPVPGATVIASVVRSNPDGIGDDPHPTRRHMFTIRTAGQDGRFEVPADEPGTSVIAKAPGFGLGYHLKGQPIRLTRGDLPINGRLVDLEGRPVAGASVRILQLYTIPDPKDRREAGARPGAYEFPYGKSLGLEGEPALPGGVVTDGDGRFRIEGLGIDVLAWLNLSGPTIALKKVKVMTRPMDRVAGDRQDLETAGVDEPGIYGADCTIVVPSSRPIEGIVRDLETKEPIPGATVTAAQVAGSTLNIEGQITARTDADGRYRLVGLPKANGHKVSVYPPLDRPYFITQYIEVPAGPGLDPVPFDIELRRGIWITGRVLNARTSEPVAASVDYFPLLANEHAKDYRNFRGEISWSIDIKTRYRTDADGRFRVVGLPGRGVLTARSDDRAFRVGSGSESIAGKDKNGQLPTYDHILTSLYQGIREVNLPKGAEAAQCDLPLDPGGSVVLRFVDEAGRPVEGVVAYGRFPEGADDYDHNVYDATSAKVGGLEPGKPRTVVLKQTDRNLGAVLELPPDGPRDGQELAVVLRPNATVAGRLVGDKLPARAGVRISTARAGSADGFLGQVPIASVSLEADGRFRFTGLPPGGSYTVEAVDPLVHSVGRMEPPAFKAFELAARLSPGAGEVVELGTFDVKLGKKVEVPAAEAGKAGPLDVPITGRVLDLEGRPVVGVSVKVEAFYKPPSGDLTPWLDAVKKGEPPWTAFHNIIGSSEVPKAAGREATTDHDGRFRLEGFGAERVVVLRLTGETVAATDVHVVTRKLDPIGATGFASHYGPGSQTVYGADFALSVRPGRPVEGVVIDAETRRPMAGVEVQSEHFAGSDFGGINILKAITDARGKFRIIGLPKGKGNALLAVPNDGQPYFQRELKVDDPPGIGPVPVEIDLHRGIWIVGKVTDKATGEPARNARLHYLPFLDNKYVQALPEFGQGGYNVQGSQMRYQTRADGSYKLVGMPGRAVVGVDNGGKPAYRSGAGFEAFKPEDLNEYGYLKTWNNPIWAGKMWPLAMKEINPAEGTEEVSLDLQLDPGLSVRLRVVDAEGKPVSEAVAVGSGYGKPTQKAPGGELDLLNFSAGEKRNVIVRHEGRKLARVVRVGPGDDANGPVVVTLAAPARVRGRTVDADGRPLPRTKIRPDLKPGGDFGLNLGQVVADADGRFEVNDVPTGCDYTMFAEAGTMLKDFRQAWVEAKVKPGETTDVGDIRFKKD